MDYTRLGTSSSSVTQPPGPVNQTRMLVVAEVAEAAVVAVPGNSRYKTVSSFA